MYKHLLIATDGSDLTQRGVDQGLSLAKRLKAKVTFVVVSELITGITVQGEPDAGLVAKSAELRRSSDVAAKKILSRVGEEAKAAGVAYDLVHVHERIPAEGIVETADELGCDLVVMASHGRRGIERLLPRSQTQEVVTTAKVPVLVVR